MSDQLITEATTSTTHNKHPCIQLDLIPRSQQLSGRRPMP